MSKLSNIVIIANSQIRSDSLSGSDRIFIELAKRWSRMGQKILLVTCQEGYEMCRRYGLVNVNYIISISKHNLPVYLSYFLRLLRNIILVSKIGSENVVVYSSCDFWPDSIPAWLFKLKFKRVTLRTAGFYLFAPIPFNSDTPYKGSRRFRGLFYYFFSVACLRI